MPVEIWRMSELQPGQRMLLALVVGFTASGNGCTMSNTALGESLGCSARTVRRWLADLQARNLICITKQGGHRVATGVDTAMTGGGGHSYGRGGGHSYGHHIGIDTKNDNHHNNGKEMRTPTTDDVTLYMITHERVQQCRLSHADVRRMASEAVHHYDANGWHTKDGTPITRWRGVMSSWVKRALKDYRPPQRRPRMSADEIRRQIAWHTKRRDNYAATDRQHLADSEQSSINALRHALDEME